MEDLFLESDIQIFHAHQEILSSQARRLRFTVFQVRRRSPAKSCTWSQGINDDFLFINCIKDQITRAQHVPRNEALKENKPATRDTRNRIPFTVTYDPALPNIHDILRKKQPIL